MDHERPGLGGEPAGSSRRPTDLLGTLCARAGLFTFLDLILLVYLGIASSMVWNAPPGAVQAECARRLHLSIAALVLACYAARELTKLTPRFRSALYRVVLLGVVVSNYLMLRDFLPLVRPDSMDEALLHVDLATLGFEPALWFERYNRLLVVEWFSFFYFSYVFLCFGYTVAVVWIGRLGRPRNEFAIGTALVLSVAQLLYTVVPAYGPGRYLARSFHGPVQGAYFWDCVSRTVEAGSPMKDVFPSLHTAVPAWFALFAVRRARRDRRWRSPAVLTGFVAANIIVSTMLLRCHYAIDVMAGLVLAWFAAAGSRCLARVEDVWRVSIGRPPAWSFHDSMPIRVSHTKATP